MQEAGAQLRSSAGLGDPIVEILARFLPVWQELLQLRSIETPRFQESDNKETLSTLFGTEGYLLDFKTSSWAVYGLWDEIGPNVQSRVSYGVRVRLVRLSDRKSVWRGGCHQEEIFIPVLSAQELAGQDGAERVRAVLSRLALSCADDLEQQVLGTRPASDQ